MSKDDKLDPLSIVAKLAAEERRLSEGTFLAPVVRGGRVKVRVSGIVYELMVDGEFEGWALLRMSEPGKAAVIDKASPALVGKYLQLFPRVRMIMVQAFEGLWWALAASTSDTRIELTGPAPVQLVGAATQFDTVDTRFDGSAFWFEGINRKRDPSVARNLTKSLANKVHPDELRCHGALPQERLAYKMLYIQQYGDQPPETTDDRSRISAALTHAGAELDRFWYQNEHAVVRFTVDQQTHTVTIRPGDLNVLSAGICLSGRDGDFDLGSLVGVFREHANFD